MKVLDLSPGCYGEVSVYVVCALSVEMIGHPSTRCSGSYKYQEQSIYFAFSFSGQENIGGSELLVCPQLNVTRDFMCYMYMFTQAFRSYQMQETACHKGSWKTTVYLQQIKPLQSNKTSFLLDVFSHICPHPLEALCAMS